MNTAIRLAWLCVLGSVVCAPAAKAANRISDANDTVTLRSSNEQVALIELYTSEGCSSCPPADRWLSGFRTQPDLWRQFVPVAFHVDYWDSLGWKDRFAQPDFSQRQQQYVRNHHLSQVYTPGVLLRGAEWRAWPGSTTVPEGAQPDAGPLQLQTSPGNRVSARWRPARRTQGPIHCTLVLLGMGLVTSVRRGENAGRELHHDFVVLGSSTALMTVEGDHLAATVALPAAHISAARYALAAWVSQADDPAPLQTVGGWWPPAAMAASSQRTATTYAATDLTPSPLRPARSDPVAR